MFSFDVFAEIIVVGGLLLLAFMPVFIRLYGVASVMEYLKVGTGRFTVDLLLAYAVGVAGNRIADDLLDLIDNPGEEYSEAYETWAKDNPTKPQRLKMAEFSYRENHKEATTVAWLDRHQSYVRILRGGSVASVLLLLAMIGYQLARPTEPRYKAVYFFASFFLLIIFATAYYSEERTVKKRGCQLYTSFKECLK